MRFKFGIFLILFFLIASNSNAKIRDGSFENEGKKISYKIFSDVKNDPAPPLVVVGGIPGGDYEYLSNIAFLAMGRRVIFYNINKSSQHNNRSSLDDFESELRDLVKHLGLKKYALFGHSLGASVAIKYSAKYKDEILGLILLSPIINGEIYNQNIAQSIDSLGSFHKKILLSNYNESEDFAGSYNIFAKKYICNKEYCPEMEMYFSSQKKSEDFKSIWGENKIFPSKTIIDIKLENELDKLDMPVLMLAGESDLADWRKMEKIFLPKLKKGSIVIFEKSSSFSHVEEPQLFIYVTGNFLKELLSS